MACQSCTAAGAAANSLAACVSGTSQLSGSEHNGGCDPTYCDRIDAENSSSADWSACFGTTSAFSSALQCTGLRCAQEETPSIVNGKCSCSRETGVPLAADGCAYSYCEGGSTGISSGAGCLCNLPGSDSLKSTTSEPRGTSGDFRPW